ncbi:MAG: HIT family protein [Chloroflexota bacterium]
MSDCPFCLIAAGHAPAEVVYRWPDALAIVPLNPATPGHLLVISRVHVDSATSDPVLAGLVAECAAELAVPPCNLIANCGAEASQTVPHLHWHIVPRRAGDGLKLPWTDQVVAA